MVVSRFMQQLLVQHWSAVKRILVDIVYSLETIQVVWSSGKQHILVVHHLKQNLGVLQTPKMKSYGFRSSFMNLEFTIQSLL
ncbi:hypothetical protein AAHE18_05G256100 [Arachis hypogaea]